MTQSLSLIGSFVLVLIITSTELDSYIAPILGLIIIFSIIYAVIKGRTTKNPEIFVGSKTEVFAITLALVLAVFLTGGLNSNIFFLLYFLIFGIVFLFKPETVFVLLLGLIAVFFTSLADGDLFSNLIKLGSLAFLSPISYFFGREFQKRERLEEEVSDKTGQILEDAQTLRAQIHDENALDEIEDIEKEAKELKKQATSP